VSHLLTGSPVRKAVVLLGPNQGKESYRAVTDVNGHFAIAGIVPGKYVAWVQRQGFLPVVYGAHGPNRPGKFLILSAGEARKTVNFSLEPPGVITGHIYDEDGEPLSVAVQLWRESWRTGRRTLDQAGGAASNDEGEYRLYGLPSGNYFVGNAQSPVRPSLPGNLSQSREVYAQTYYPGSEELTGAAPIKLAAGSEARNIDLHVRKTTSVTVSGVVNGPPGQNVMISFARHGEITRGASSGTNAGTFSLRGITPGSYTLTAVSHGNEQSYYAQMNVDVGTLDVEGVQVNLQRALDVAGVLRFDSDSPPDPSDFQVSLQIAIPGSASARPMRPAKDGTFTWSNTVPGTWGVTVSRLPASFYMSSPSQVEITPSMKGPIEVVISGRGARLGGKVLTPADQPVEAATVLLVKDGKDPQAVKYGITDPDGKFAMQAIPPGKYRLLAIEDIETMSWQNPDVLAPFEGKGVAVELPPAASLTQNLVVTQ
jgi:hypothetical protein